MRDINWFPGVTAGAMTITSAVALSTPNGQASAPALKQNQTDPFQTLLKARDLPMQAIETIGPWYLLRPQAARGQGGCPRSVKVTPQGEEALNARSICNHRQNPLNCRCSGRVGLGPPRCASARLIGPRKGSPGRSAYRRRQVTLDLRSTHPSRRPSRQRRARIHGPSCRRAARHRWRAQPPISR